MSRRPKLKRATDAPPLLDWAREYLPHYFTNEPAAFHRELLDTLAARKHRLVARVAPRGHAKSTCAALAYPLWCLCHATRTNIVIVTHESSLATQFVRDIRAELETNERIIETYGDLSRSAPCDDEEPQGKPTRGKRTARRAWTDTRLTAANGVTIQPKGTGASFRGARVGPNRPDLIICDDLEKDEHVASAEQRAKLERWLRRVVMPALAPGGQVVVLGSIIHYDSLLANLRDPQRFPRWDYRVYRALEYVPGGQGEYRPVALWPDRWSVRQLLEEKQRVGSLAFEQEYQANPIDDSLRIFRPEWLRGYDPAELAGKELVTLMAVDPATGVTGGDFFALWVGDVDVETGVIYTRRLRIDRIGIVQQIRLVIDTFVEFRPAKVGIETVSYQVALKDMLDEIGRREKLYMPTVAIRTVLNKRARIEGASAFFENGTFRLPVGLDDEVIAQFLRFPKAKHDDAPDVCAMAIELARDLRDARGPFDSLVGARNPFGRRGGW
jgi:predicted phage terminase large subunit-like protein